MSMCAVKPDGNVSCCFAKDYPKKNYKMYVDRQTGKHICEIDGEKRFSCDLPIKTNHRGVNR